MISGIEVLAIALTSTVSTLNASALRQTDSIYTKPEVVVRAHKISPYKDFVQNLDSTVIARFQPYSVADVLRFFAGVQLKDYGGLSGMKVINMRSMGSSHLTLVYDGAILPNSQNGMIDPGMIGTQDVGRIVVVNGSEHDPLSSATQRLSAGSIQIQTQPPTFEHTNTNTQISVKAGSFHTMAAAAQWKQRWKNQWKSTLSADYIYTAGNYPFRYVKYLSSGLPAYDTTAVRKNGDMRLWRTEANLYAYHSQRKWHTKAYFYVSERGLPGAVVSNVWKRGERQNDIISFLQSSCIWGKEGNIQLKLAGKYNFQQLNYKDLDPYSQIPDAQYRQQSLWLSVVGHIPLSPQWKLSSAYDFALDKLHSNSSWVQSPLRIAQTAAISGTWTHHLFATNAEWIVTYIADKRHNVPIMWNKGWVPGLYMYYTVPTIHNLQVRAFVKHSLRMPTFNEQHYTGMGNRILKPERAWQFDLGLKWNNQQTKTWGWHLSFLGDIYYNKVYDKIMAYPRGQLFRWSVYNIAQASIYGVEGILSADKSLTRVGRLIGKVQYTYQHAIDKSNEKDLFYNHQLPYIAEHSATITLGWNSTKWWFNAVTNYIGKRYDQSENSPANKLSPVCTVDAMAGYLWHISRYSIELSMSVKNILAQNYEMIRNYPMPQRQWDSTLTIKF